MPSSSIEVKGPHTGRAGWLVTASGWWASYVRKMWFSRSWRLLLMLLGKTGAFQRLRNTSRYQTEKKQSDGAKSSFQIVIH